MATIRAYEVRDKALVPVERPEPVAGPGQVVVCIRATSLNYRDLMIVRGEYKRNQVNGVVPLSDGAGEVVAVGPGVTRFAVGDRVAATFMQSWTSGPIGPHHGSSALGGAIDGTLAERVAFAAAGLVRIPEHLSFEQAATLPCAAVTAWNALFDTATTRPGQTVLVQGTGGVSLFALQLARAAGARVIATSSSDAKLARVRELGAAATINYKTTTAWGEEALRITDGVGVDHVIDVGGAGTFEQSLAAVRLGGTISYIGVLSGVGGQVSPGQILLKNARVHGIFVGSRAMFEALNAALAESRILPVIDRVFRFDQAADAYRYLESGAHVGKVVISVD
ncbi:MAG TPA: NAD(P)-dependent alcohol dehydrogenase [Polyangium sp.]|nr:NAD(P)-dependent alcohol dehydrogenase [Polyangium sp.]